jgi:hypothetical protein
MASHGTSLSHLCQCFQGSLPKDIDWISLISLANQTLTTPALQDVAEDFSDEIPKDVHRYIGEIFARTLVRNDRLTEQLTEALAALNARGITPILMKGSAMLATLPRAKMGQRLVTDLDLMVSPDEVEPALDCLQDIGYRTHWKARAGAAKWYVDLARPHDAGMIDLHQCPPGHRFFYSAAGDIRHHCRLQGAAYIPSATYHALMLIIHDQFQDSDYWVGRIDLRHLLDLRDLANSPDGIDWSLLASLAPGNLARNAIETQLVTLSSLLGVSVPDHMRRRVVPRLQYWRRRLQAHLPVSRHALFLLMLFDYGNYRAEVGLEERAARQLAPRRWILPRIETARFLLALAREPHAGKV